MATDRVELYPVHLREQAQHLGGDELDRLYIQTKQLCSVKGIHNSSATSQVSSTLPSGTPCRLFRRRERNSMIGSISSRFRGIASPGRFHL